MDVMCVRPTACRQRLLSVLIATLSDIWKCSTTDQQSECTRKNYSSRHQVGIWTGVKSSHNTSVCLHMHAHTHTLTDTTHAHKLRHIHTAPSAEVTAVWQQPNPTCVSIETETVIPLLPWASLYQSTRLANIAFSRDEHLHMGHNKYG